MEPIDLAFLLSGKQYSCKLIIQSGSLSKKFEVVSCIPPDARFEKKYLFTPDHERKMLVCSQVYSDQDYFISQTIAASILIKCAQLQIPVFED